MPVPFIIGYNISPSADSGWRLELGKLIEEVTATFLIIPPRDVSCFFPHDPSVPGPDTMDPYPIATLIVEPLFERPERTGTSRNEYAKVLARAVAKFLNEHRGTTDATVEVAVKGYNQGYDGFYQAP